MVADCPWAFRHVPIITSYICKSIHFCLFGSLRLVVELVIDIVDLFVFPTFISCISPQCLSFPSKAAVPSFRDRSYRSISTVREGKIREKESSPWKTSILPKMVTTKFVPFFPGRFQQQWRVRPLSGNDWRVAFILAVLEGRGRQTMEWMERRQGSIKQVAHNVKTDRSSERNISRNNGNAIWFCTATGHAQRKVTGDCLNNL